MPSHQPSWLESSPSAPRIKFCVCALIPPAPRQKHRVNPWEKVVRGRGRGSFQPGDRSRFEIFLNFWDCAVWWWYDETGYLVFSHSP